MDAPQHTNHGSRGKFYIEQDGRTVAILTYTVSGDTVIINHTEVDPPLRGDGTGTELVEAAVHWARGEHKRVLPLCPFARAVFDRTPAFADVLSG